jgi:hypothetical protein
MRKASFSKIKAIVDEIWQKHILISKELLDEVDEALEKNGWTEEEFDNLLDN